MQTWEILKESCLACTKCSLAETRTQVVFGTGNPNAEIWFVGEAPGANEDMQGLPFVGRSGKLLDKYLSSIGLSRDKNIFITNIVKCRPPENRDPSSTEKEKCILWLKQQFLVKRPKIIVCVGRIAAQILIRKNFAITREHGTWEEKDGMLFTAILHPAAILRNPHQSALVESDMLIIKEKLLEICTNE